MEKAKSDSETKSRLVTEICNISNYATASSCPHRRRCRPKNAAADSLFVDWYLVLRVNENADAGMIRKCYLRLALLLHPDKNNHPEAEFAFKLITEAYSCLSDKAKRKAFDLERQKSSCTECTNVSPTAFKFCTKTQATSRELFSSRRGKMFQRMKDLRIRFGEEATVIENCLRAYTTPRRSVSTASKTEEYPIFNPADYGSHGYPHVGATYKKTTQESYSRLLSKRILSS